MIARSIIIGLAAISMSTHAVSAGEERTLTSVAAADGYTFEWLPTEGGAVLTRPGVRIVLRADRLFYEVNNATPIADRAPEFDGEDLRISPALAERLRQIALRTAAAAPNPLETVRIASGTAATARPLTIDAKQVPGRLALALSGSGTPNAVIAITLTAEMSSELPVVTIRRSTLTVGSDGTYATAVGYGLYIHKGTRLSASAAYASGSGRAVAHVLVNGEVTGVDSTSLDDFPKN